MPIWLQIADGVVALLGFCVSIYVIVDKKSGTTKKDIEQLKSDIIQVKRITGIVDEYMQELLLENLKRKK